MAFPVVKMTSFNANDAFSSALLSADDNSGHQSSNKHKNKNDGNTYPQLTIVSLQMLVFVRMTIVGNWNCVDILSCTNSAFKRAGSPSSAVVVTGV